MQSGTKHVDEAIFRHVPLLAALVYPNAGLSRPKAFPVGYLSYARYQRLPCYIHVYIILCPGELALGVCVSSSSAAPV